MLLNVSAVSFAYSRRTPVLRDVSFTIDRGERVGLVGSNGSGKSTLIRLLADLLHLRHGSISISDRPHRARESRESIAYVASNDYLPLFLTGREYIELMHRLYGVRADAARTEDAFARYQLRSRQDELIEDYSHGMRKKVQVISSLLVRRPLTIIDETLNGVDADALDEFTRDARALRPDSALLFCSHDFRLVESVCDRVIVLRRGEVRHDLPLAQILEQHGSVDALVKLTNSDVTPTAGP